MSIGNLDLDVADRPSLEEWLKSDGARELQHNLEERIMQYLFSMDPNSSAFQLMVERLAWIGSNNKSLLGRDIAQLRRSLDNGELTRCGLKAIWQGAANVAHFLAAHKTEILVGAALCATGIGIAAALGYTVTASVSGIAIAGAGSIFQQAEKPNPHIPRHAPPPPPIAQPYIPQLELPPADLLVTTDGIWCNGQFYSNTELMKSSLLAEALATHPETKWNFYPQSPPPLPTGEFPFASSAPSNTYEIPRTPHPTDNQPPPSIRETHPFRNEAPPPISRHFTLSGTQDTRTHIGWINGVNNTFEESKASGTYIQTLAGGHAILGIYNHTHTILVDLAEAALLNHNGLSPITAPLLQAQWTAFHEANADRPNLKFLQFCHSQGTIHVRNALEGLPPEIADRVMVIAVAPGAIVPKRLCFKAFNYASEKDVVYKFEPPFPRPVDDVLLPAFEESDVVERAELIILKAHPGATGIDHEVQSLTFLPYLKEILEDYEKHNGEYTPEEKGQ